MKSNSHKKKKVVIFIIFILKRKRDKHINEQFRILESSKTKKWEKEVALKHLLWQDNDFNLFKWI